MYAQLPHAYNAQSTAIVYHRRFLDGICIRQKGQEKHLRPGQALRTCAPYADFPSPRLTVVLNLNPLRGPFASVSHAKVRGSSLPHAPLLRGSGSGRQHGTSPVVPLL